MTPPDFFVDSEYVDDGYIYSPNPVALVSGSTRLDFVSPGRRSGTVKVIQPMEITSGWKRTVFSPRMTLHTMAMEYTWMSGIMRGQLETFFADVEAMAEQWSYIDCDSGVETPVWFDTPELSFTERRHDTYNTTVAVRALQTFFPVSGTAPTLSDADSILTRLYYPTEFKLTRQQGEGWSSDGTFYITDHTNFNRPGYALDLLYRTRSELAAIISLFSEAALGMKNTFSWTLDGMAKTVRFGDTVLSWQQRPLYEELYDVHVTLEDV